MLKPQAIPQAIGVFLLVSTGCFAGQPSNANFHPFESYFAGYWPSHVVAGDVNDDGRPDLVASNAQNQTLSVLHAIPGGDFAAPQTVSVGAFPTGLALWDF